MKRWGDESHLDRELELELELERSTSNSLPSGPGRSGGSCRQL